jgi:hypothetical protein
MLDNDALPPKPKSSGKKRAANPAVSGGRSTQKEAAAAPPPRRQIIRIYIGGTPDDFQGEPRYSITAEMKGLKTLYFREDDGTPCGKPKRWSKEFTDFLLYEQSLAKGFEHGDIKPAHIMSYFAYKNSSQPRATRPDMPHPVEDAYHNDF